MFLAAWAVVDGFPPALFNYPPIYFHSTLPLGHLLPATNIHPHAKSEPSDRSMRCPLCHIPLSLASLEQIWRGPDFEHRLTYQCETCGLQFGVEPYDVAEPIQVGDT